MRFDRDRIDRRRLIPALLLIGLGLLGLLGGLGGLFGRLLGTALFAAAAVAAYAQATRTGSFLWRAAVYPLAGLAAATLLDDPAGGAAFLASLALPFALAWRDDERRWWALIPAGTLASLAATSLIGGMLAGAVFLLGLAATFFALTRLRVQPQAWGVYPAVVLALLGVLTLSGSATWWLPLLMVAAGVALLLRSERGPAPGAAAPGAASPAPTAPAPSDPAPSAALQELRSVTTDRPAEDGGGETPPATDPERGS